MKVIARVTAMLNAFRRPPSLDDRPAVSLAHLESGDLVLFSGRTFAARLVQCWTGSYWSHVGIVIRMPEYGNVPLLWEATRANKVADIHRGACRDGVQLVPLAEKLASYTGEVAVRRLVDDGHGHCRYQCLRPLLQEWQALPYCNFVFKQLRVWWRGHEAAPFRHGGFCSELVAEVYQRLSLLPLDKPPMDYVPRDFGPEASLSLLRGRLSPLALLSP
ncbi:MAG: hypothetical protein Q8J78_03685 [Moraxellaceae bacterium]|nr:hypothetical protein [Moraxellaceae bacterium]